MAKMVDVPKGQIILFCLDRGGSGPQAGGWFKANYEDEMGPQRSLMGVALESFSYEPDLGARYHDVKFKAVKRFYHKGIGVKVLCDRGTLKELETSSAPPEGLADAGALPKKGSEKLP